MKEGGQGFLALKLNFICNTSKLCETGFRYFLYHWKVLINYKQLVPQNTFYAVQTPLNMIYSKQFYVGIKCGWNLSYFDVLPKEYRLE